MSTAVITHPSETATPSTETETAQAAATRLTSRLAEDRDEYREFGVLPPVRERLAARAGLTTDELNDVYAAYEDVLAAHAEAEWTGRTPWDDAAEQVIQNTVHGYTDELTRVLRHHGYTGRVTADRLTDLGQ